MVLTTMVTSGHYATAAEAKAYKMDDMEFSRMTGNRTFIDGEEDSWRRHVRQKMEEELERRVREALDTPPLERQRRAREQAQRNRIEGCEEMNAHLDLVEKERESTSARRQRLQLARSREIDSRLHFRRLVEPHTLPNLLQQQQQRLPEDYFEMTTSMLEQLQIRRDEERSNYFGDPDDLTYEDDDELLAARNGIALPSGVKLLLPPPEFISSVPEVPEPLLMGHEEGPDTFDSQCTPYTHKWRGICIVFDSEKWPKDQQPGSISNPLVAPNLMFESRFETGNLRQARRVGQFEYELLLKTDLYTKRHTQWYYFRIQNMVPSVTYKFRIVNFLKKDSLYNYGMKPLFYSEVDAKSKNVGWIRKGHHIRYSANLEHLASPLLSRDLAYYELEWQIEFPNGGDTCYLAHCYPYTFTDLKSDLDAIMADPKRNGVTKREVMCETRAGNSCFLLTVTNFDVKTMKKCVVVSARVHPGETNASWMMKGLIDFITGPDSRAEELRRKFVFKIVPMLNPDGVIIGNYRCGLAGKDLNRNYRHPRRESFPTVACTKNMVLQMQSKMEVLIYCDLHGHSRKSNVFMYGCNSPESSAGDIRAFLDERIFPFLVAKHAPDAFSFSACKFQIKKCKESTGRVVMYRQMKIKNSFTLEATFSGTIMDKSGSRHFNQRDFQEVGKVFCLGVHEYARMLEDKQKESEVVLDLAREIAHQILKLKGYHEARHEDEQRTGSADAGGGTPSCVDAAPADGCLMAEAAASAGQLAATAAPADGEATATRRDSAIAGDDGCCSSAQTQLATSDLEASSVIVGHDVAADTCISTSPAASSTGTAAGVDSRQNIGSSTTSLVLGNRSDERLRVLEAFDSISETTIQECLGLLGQLNFNLGNLESDSSSDSDSESEPEAKVTKPKVGKKKRKRSKKKKEKRVRSRSSSSSRKPHASADGSQTSVQAAGSSSEPGSVPPPPALTEPISRPFVLPTIGGSTADKDNKLHVQDKETSPQKGGEKFAKSYQWTNPYAGRSNGGIPCFSEERSLERAAKRINDLRKKTGEANQSQLYPPPPPGTIVWHDGAAAPELRGSYATAAEQRQLALGNAATAGDVAGSVVDIEDDYYQQWLSFHFERERTQELLRWSLQTLADNYGPLPKVTYQHADAEADARYRHSLAASTRTTAQDHGFYARFLPPPPNVLRHAGGSQPCYTYADWIDPLACSLITLSALHSPYGGGDSLALLPADDGARRNVLSPTSAGEPGGRTLSRTQRAHSEPSMHASTDVLSTVGLRRQVANQPTAASGALASGSGMVSGMPPRKPSWRLKHSGGSQPTQQQQQQLVPGKPPVATNMTTHGMLNGGSRLSNGGSSGISSSKLGASHLAPLSMSAPAIHGHPAFRATLPAAAAAAAAGHAGGAAATATAEELGSDGIVGGWGADVSNGSGCGLPPVSQVPKQPSRLMSRDYTELLTERLKQQQQMLASQHDLTAKSELLRSWSRQSKCTNGNS